MPTFTVISWTQQQQIYGVKAWAIVENEAEAKQIAASFPKSWKVFGTSSYNGEKWQGYVGIDVHLQSDKVNGGVNESGLRRIRSFLKKVEWTYNGNAYSNSTPEAELRALLEGK